MTSRATDPATRRAVAAVVAVAVLFGAALLAAPVGAAGQPVFYTDEFHFTFENTELSAICGFPVYQTLDGYVRGWARLDENGDFLNDNVQVTTSGTFYSDRASVPYRGRTRTITPDNSVGDGVVTGLRLLVTVPGQGAVGLIAGRLEVTFPAGGGAPTFAATGRNTEGDFFGTVGDPGTLCTLLAG